MTAAITQAVREGAETVICASTGNTAASAAAYAARAGLRCLVLVPQGKIALGKLAASLAYGAEVISIDGSFDDGLRIVREITEHRPIALVNSVNPWRLEGQKTGAFEIVDQLGGRAPDWHCLPVGNAGNISAYWMGFTEYRAAGLVETAPVMLGFQAEGAAPLVLGHRVDHPETFATAIRIGDPASADKALAARDESGRHHRRQRRRHPGRLAHAGQVRRGMVERRRPLAGRAAAADRAGEIDPAGQDGGHRADRPRLKDPGTAVEQASAPVTLPARIEALEEYLNR
jgi:threonine synthase